MKKSSLFLLAGLLVLITGCSRSCSSWNRDVQSGNREYEVVMYSGGDTVFYDKVTTIVNSSQNSDGIYYFKGDTLVEVSGDYILKSVDH